MKRQYGRRWKTTLAVSCGVALSATAAHAATTCNVGTIEGLGVAGVSVVSATSVAAAGTTPAYCDVVGQLNTSGGGAPEGSAGFEIRLPANWNDKFLFFGVGGLAGSAYGDFSASPTDLSEALVKGYATAITDEGHLSGNTDASFTLLAPGKPDEAKLADYYNRSTHEVTVAGKELVAAFYGAKSVKRAYFDGCSNGGRQALVEATQFPTDYDGIIAGDPFFDIRSILNGVKIAKQALTASTYIPAALLPAIDAAINASCVKTDGVNDTLIQNPAACNFDAYSLLCTAGQTTGCLSPGQAQTLNSYFTATRNTIGGVVYPGFSVSNLSTSSTGPLTGGGADAWTFGYVPPTSFTAREPWGNGGFSPAPYGYQFADHIIQDIIERNPAYNTRSYPVSAAGTVSFDTLAQFDARTAAGDALGPDAYDRYIDRGRKLIIYHGYSDPALTPFRSINLYHNLANHRGGYAQLQQSARLFMVPGMQHCIGGPGPNTFDTLSPLENWVENGVAPTSIVAAHFTNNDPSKPIDRTMPLCPYPTEATYNKTGDINTAASWSCTPNERLLQVGTNGTQAGVQVH